jgi:hypothetical protein
MLVAIFRSILRDRTQSKLGQLRGDWQPRQMLFSLRSMPSQIYSGHREICFYNSTTARIAGSAPELSRRTAIELNIESASVAAQEAGPVVRKLIAFDDDTFDKLKQLGRDRMATIQELADEAFADVLRKHGIPVDLKDALRKSASLAKTPVKNNARSSPSRKTKS